MSAFSRNTVLVPVDFSEESENSLRTSVELTGDASKVVVIHVLPPLEAISPGVVWGEISDESRTESVKKYAIEFLKKNGAQGAHLEVRVGSPGHEITEYSEQIDADLIVISSHGYHGIKRILLGSVAEAVIRHASCAVLVLRRQDAE